MSSIRRYSEDEMRAIFEQATKAQHERERERPALEPTGGLTLEELQVIGQEVGIPAELVAGAAKDLDRPQPAGTVRRMAGLPVGVGRTVELGRRLTDDEWDVLVSELRETFEARGSV